MDVAKKLNYLRAKIESVRSGGQFKAYPMDIKKEVLGLASEIGPTKVARETGLAMGLLYLWRKQIGPSPEKIKCTTALETGKLDMQITRVVAECKKQEIFPVASVMREGLEIRFFDVSLAASVCEKVLR